MSANFQWNLFSATNFRIIIVFPIFNSNFLTFLVWTKPLPLSQMFRTLLHQRFDGQKQYELQTAKMSENREKKIKRSGIGLVWSRFDPLIDESQDEKRRAEEKLSIFYRRIYTHKNWFLSFAKEYLHRVPFSSFIVCFCFCVYSNLLLLLLL